MVILWNKFPPKIIFPKIKTADRRIDEQVSCYNGIVEQNPQQFFSCDVKRWQSAKKERNLYLFLLSGQQRQESDLTMELTETCCAACNQKQMWFRLKMVYVALFDDKFVQNNKQNKVSGVRLSHAESRTRISQDKKKLKQESILVGWILLAYQHTWSSGYQVAYGGQMHHR